MTPSTSVTLFPRWIYLGVIYLGNAIHLGMCNRNYCDHCWCYQYYYYHCCCLLLLLLLWSISLLLLKTRLSSVSSCLYPAYCNHINVSSLAALHRLTRVALELRLHQTTSNVLPKLPKLTLCRSHCFLRHYIVSCIMAREITTEFNTIGWKLTIWKIDKWLHIKGFS